MDSGDRHNHARHPTPGTRATTTPSSRSCFYSTSSSANNRSSSWRACRLTGRPRLTRSWSQRRKPPSVGLPGASPTPLEVGPMASNNVVLTARVMPAPKKAGASDVARFVRYVQYRDIHPDSKQAQDVDDLIAYVHHRDPTSPRGRMFDAEGPAGEEQRRALVDLVSRSNEELLARESPSRTSLRAAYRLMVSPEDARGLDLKR